MSTESMSVEIIESLAMQPLAQSLKNIEQHTFQVERLYEEAKTFEVVSNWSMEAIHGLAGEIKSKHKEIETDRKELTEPFRKYVNKANDRAKFLTEKLKNAEEIIKAKIALWKEEIERKNKEAEASAKALTESLGLSASLYVENAPKTIRGDGALSYEMTQWKFDVEDLSIVPREFLSIDEAKVKGALKMGHRNIPGLKIYSEQKTIIKAR